MRIKILDWEFLIYIYNYLNEDAINAVLDP